jgi:hypothetical protein
MQRSDTETVGTARSSTRFQRAVPTLALPTQNALILHRELEALHQFQLWHYASSSSNAGPGAISNGYATHLPSEAEGSSMARCVAYASKPSAYAAAASMLAGSSKRSLQHQAAQNAARRSRDIPQHARMAALENLHTVHTAQHLVDASAGAVAASNSPTQLSGLVYAQQQSGDHSSRLASTRRTSSEAQGAVVAALLGGSLQQGAEQQQEQGFEGWRSRMAWQVCSKDYA